LNIRFILHGYFVWQSSWGGRSLQAAVALLYLAAASPASAGGPLGIDHTWALDNTGVWSQGAQNVVEYGAIAAAVGSGIYFGRDNPLGQTSWQSVDATAISAVSAEILKLAFSRARPNQGNDPNRWFQGGCCDSFPSGEVTLTSSVVTPFIVGYSREHPWVWSLEALPLYIALARLKNQAHWQTDVIAGWALGTGVGYWSTRREVPISVQILPRGLTVGIYRSY
jgi:membrane-associated phospholipid phosphatase